MTRDTRGTGPEGRPGKTSTLLAPSERERLIAAMAASCAARGYRGASVEEVLSRSGLERGDFERHFSGKADCALAAVDEILAETTQAVAGAASPELADWQFLLAATLALLELMAARPSYARLACIEARGAMPAEAYERYAAGIRVIVAMLDRVRDYAKLSAPPSATRGAIGGAELLIRRELIAGRAERLPELLPDIIYGTVVPFLDQQEALRYAELAKEMIKEGG
jgi:AcrR family transcriptional regulator